MHACDDNAGPPHSIELDEAASEGITLENASSVTPPFVIVRDKFGNRCVRREPWELRMSILQNGSIQNYHPTGDINDVSGVDLCSLPYQCDSLSSVNVSKKLKLNLQSNFQPVPYTAAFKLLNSVCACRISFGW